MIVFEELCLFHRGLISWCAWRKEEMCFIRMNTAAEEVQFSKKVRKIFVDSKPTTLAGFYYDDAFEAIDKFFCAYQNKAMVKSTARLYENDATLLAYKKAFNDVLARFLYLNHLMHLLSERYQGMKVMFLPSNGILNYRTDSCEIYDYFRLFKQAKKVGVRCYDTGSVKFPWRAVALSYINAFKRKCGVLVRSIGFLGWCFVRGIITAFRKKQPKNTKHYRYAVTIVSTKRQFANEIQKVDFLIDGDLIKKKEVIFLSHKILDNNARAYLKNHQLDYLDDLGSYVSFKEVSRVMREYLALFPSFFKEDSLMLETNLKGLFFYVTWESLTRNIQIDNLIAYCSYEIKSIFRNIMLQGCGCKTYQYNDSMNFGYFFRKDNVKTKYSFELGFLFGDYFIVWNKAVIDYFKFIHFDFKHYIDVGCFWSEHLRLIREGQITSNVKVSLNSKGYKPGMKIISVFDSTFHDNSFTPYSDGIIFLEDMLRLADDFEDVFIILKEKKLRSLHKANTSRYLEILRIYEKFDQHPRCFCVNSDGNSSEVIAASDLTISFPFTSTTFEALCARRKAIWFDATDKYNETFYCNIPGLVCHNYKDLSRRVKALLYDISQEEYEQYLDKHVKGKVELYMDGRAISRFRELLNDPFSSFNELSDRPEFALDKD